MSTSASWNPLDQKSRQIAAVQQSLSLHTAQQTGQEGRESKKNCHQNRLWSHQAHIFLPFHCQNSKSSFESVSYFILDPEKES